MSRSTAQPMRKVTTVAQIFVVPTVRCGERRLEDGPVFDCSLHSGTGAAA